MDIIIIYFCDKYVEIVSTYYRTGKLGAMVRMDKFNFERLADQSELGMMIFENGNVTYANRACESILEYPLELIVWAIKRRDKG